MIRPAHVKIHSICSSIYAKSRQQNPTDCESMFHFITRPLTDYHILISVYPEIKSNNKLSAGVVFFLMKTFLLWSHRESASWPGLWSRRQWTQRGSRSFTAPQGKSQRWEEEARRRRITSTIWRMKRRRRRRMTKKTRTRTARTNPRGEGQRRRKWRRLVYRGKEDLLLFPACSEFQRHVFPACELKCVMVGSEVSKASGFILWGAGWDQYVVWKCQNDRCHHHSKTY